MSRVGCERSRLGLVRRLTTRKCVSVLAKKSLGGQALSNQTKAASNIKR